MNKLKHKSSDNQLGIVSDIISRLQPEIYLELGIKKGNTISNIAPYAKRAIGVDIKKPSGNIKGYEFYEMTTDKFFEKIKAEKIKLSYIDAAFIDANHNSKYVLRDFYNVWALLRNQGVIILHDTYPKNKKFTSKELCGDAYLAAWEISLKNIPMIEYFTLPIHPGLTFIRKREYQISWEEQRVI